MAGVLRSLGQAPLVVSVRAGYNGVRLAGLLEAQGLEHRLLEVEGETRECHTLLGDPHPTEFNEAGPALEAADPERLTALIPKQAGWIVVSGSLAPGIAAEDFGHWLSRLKTRARLVVDTSGPALLAALKAGVYLVKPNQAELDAIGLAAEQAFGRYGVGILLSQGAKGVGYLGPEGHYQQSAFQVEALNPVGAGDALLAGFIHATTMGLAIPQALRGGGLSRAGGRGGEPAAGAWTAGGFGVKRLEGYILTPSGRLEGSLIFDRQILALKRHPVAADAPFILPGFIDVHVHGGGGHDVMDGLEGILGMTRFHLSHGTTALLATTITNPFERVMVVLWEVSEAMQHPAGASLLGVHLEGPFISDRRLGAQPPCTLEPTPERVAEVLKSGVVRLVTLAPELPGALGAIRTLARAGVGVSFGHAMSSAEQTTQALKIIAEAGGVVGGTHFYNAMGSLSGREPGVIGALLADPEAYAEVILDGQHVHFTAFLALLRAKPENTLLITDAMRAAGMPDGAYDLGGQTAQVVGGRARLASGSLAGSVLTMDQALHNAVKTGLSLEQASRLASEVPARYLGLASKGRLKPGLDADLVLLSKGLQIQEVYLGGERVG